MTDSTSSDVLIVGLDADGKTVAYGTAADLSQAAQCIAKGDRMLHEACRFGPSWYQRFGRSIYATISKDISNVVKLPIASYVGVAYSSYEHRVLPLAGLTINWTNNFSSPTIFDGVKVHPTFTYALGRRHVFTFLLAQGKNPGASYSISF